MKRSLGFLAATTVAVGGALVFWLASATAEHTGDPNRDEVKCETSTGGRILPKFVLKKAIAIIKCEKGERAGTNPASDCDPPLYGGDTQTRIQAEEATAEAKIAACMDCPECYNGGDCTGFGTTAVASVEAQVDGLKALVYCDDSASTDGLNVDEAACQDRVAKTLAIMAKKVAKATADCVKHEHKLQTDGACSPPAADSRTAAKIAKANTVAASKIDQKCSAVDNPDCYVPSFDTGAEWVSFTQSAVDGNYTTFYCGG